MDWRANAAREFADRRFSQRGLTLTKLARDLGVSPRYLGRIFRNENGQTFHRYLLGVRMAQARDLLDDRTLSLREIASRVGYEDVSNFCKEFRRMFGESPRAYFKIRQLTLPASWN